MDKLPKNYIVFSTLKLFLEEESSMKRLRKVLIAVGGVVALLIIIALVVPFLVDFNQFKPQIQDAVSQNLNAKLEFESARLQLFPAIGIKLTKVSIENTDPEFKGTILFSVDKLLVDAKLIPLFSKKVVGNVLIDKPEFVLAQKGVQNNLAALAKPAAPTPSAQAAAQTPAKAATVDPKQAAADQAKTMEFVKENVLIESVLIKSANVTIRDLAAKTPKEPLRIEDFNLDVSNIGLDRDIRTELTTKISVKQPNTTVSGIFAIHLLDHIKMGANGLESATFDGKVDFDQLDINAMNAFVKAPGIPLNVQFKGVFKPNLFTLDDLVFNLHNLAVQAKANIQDFKVLNTLAEVTINNNDLTRLGEVLPQHKKMLISANMHLKAGANGPLSKPEVVKAFADFSAKLGTSDIDLHLKQTSLKPMQTGIVANSGHLDLGAMLKPFMPPEAKPGAAPAAAPASAGKSPAPAAAPNAPPPKDFELTPEQKETLAGANVSLKVNLKEILYDKLDIRDLIVDLNQLSLKTHLNQFSVKAFGGEVRTKGLIDLGVSPIAFQNDFNMINIRPEQVMEFVQPEHKDVIVGRMNIQLAASGKGSTIPTLNKTLNGNGKFKFLDGELNTPSIAGVMQKEFDKYVGGLANTGMDSIAKNPLLAKAGIKTDEYKAKFASVSKVQIQDRASRHESLKDKEGKIEIRNGRMYISSEQNQPSGKTNTQASVGLDMSLDGSIHFNASDATKKQMLAQSQYASLLFDKNNNLLIEGSLGGTVMDPKVGLKTDSLRSTFTDNARAMAEKELKGAAGNYLKQLLGGGKNDDDLKKKQDEAKQKADEERKKQEEEAKEKAKNEGEKALKGLFGK